MGDIQFTPTPEVAKFLKVALAFLIVFVIGIIFATKKIFSGKSVKPEVEDSRQKGKFYKLP